LSGIKFGGFLQSREKEIGNYELRKASFKVKTQQWSSKRVSFTYHSSSI